VPTEIIEIETVMRVRRYGILEDSQSPGRWHGGAALVYELENTGLSATMTVRGMNRFHFQPWGVRGGAAGRLGKVVRNPGREDETSIGKINVLTLARGDVIRIVTPAGGGFGNPLERDIDAVLWEVECGLLSVRAARDYYGVVLTEDGRLDAEATARLRSERSRERENRAFTLGEAREAYDRLWPTEARAHLASRILEQPQHLQGVLLARVRDTVVNAGKAATISETDRLIEQELRRLTA